MLKNSLIQPRAGSAPKRAVRTSLLALALDGHRMEGVVVRKLNGSLRVQNAVGASLQLNLLTDEPELVGRVLPLTVKGPGDEGQHSFVVTWQK